MSKHTLLLSCEYTNGGVEKRLAKTLLKGDTMSYKFTTITSRQENLVFFKVHF